MQTSPQNWEAEGGTPLPNRARHRQWLMSQAKALLDFFQPRLINKAGGFYVLDDTGTPLPVTAGHQGQERQLHDTARGVHCFAIACLLHRQGAEDLLDHGMAFLWARHRDADNGGYFWGVDDVGTSNPAKQAYGHAFVLLAAASAMVAGHPEANRLLTDVREVLLRHFWEVDRGAAREEFSADWHEVPGYRGQNANMHLCEALMAAFEATGDQEYLDMAGGIAELIVNRHARAQGWRVAEHFDATWQVDRHYEGDPVFRPSGVTPGHALEWSRLLIQLWQLGARQASWLPEAARNLFDKAVQTGWDNGRGGFYYTLGWDDAATRPDRFWWPCAEGIAAAAVLERTFPGAGYEAWYRRIWGFVDAHVVDHARGGWFPELDPDLKPVNRVFSGKPDLYHALQACLIPLYPDDSSITRAIGDPVETRAQTHGHPKTES